MNSPLVNNPVQHTDFESLPDAVKAYLVLSKLDPSVLENTPYIIEESSGIELMVIVNTQFLKGKLVVGRYSLADPDNVQFRERWDIDLGGCSSTG